MLSSLPPPPWVVVVLLAHTSCGFIIDVIDNKYGNVPGAEGESWWYSRREVSDNDNQLLTQLINNIILNIILISLVPSFSIHGSRFISLFTDEYLSSTAVLEVEGERPPRLRILVSTLTSDCLLISSHKLNHQSSINRFESFTMGKELSVSDLILH